MSARPMAGMEQHPDIAEMRARYERASETMPARVVNGLIFLCGLYLAISPWVVGFHTRQTLSVNNLLTGIAVALLALGLASAYGRTHGIAWIMPLIGLWTIISPWVVSGRVATTGPVTSNVVVGALILLLGMAVAALGMTPRRKKR
jgi:MFS superfamily sulfate permease-like transporter